MGFRVEKIRRRVKDGTRRGREGKKTLVRELFIEKGFRDRVRRSLGLDSVRYLLSSISVVSRATIKIRHGSIVS